MLCGHLGKYLHVEIMFTTVQVLFILFKYDKDDVLCTDLW